MPELRKEDYWKPTLEDALNIVAKVPAIAAGIYRMRFDKGDINKTGSSNRYYR